MATLRDPRVSIAQPYKVKRFPRNPRHPFQLRFKPFALQPFMIAPVLPGETLKNLILQNRVVSDPVKAPLVGWWCEHWFFYVKHRDLAARDALAQMMINPSTDLSALQSNTANVKTYFAGHAGIDWVQLCLERITEEYFRDEGENWDVATIDTLPALQISGNSILDSFTRAADYVDRDVNVDLDADGDVEASELDLAYMEWLSLRESGNMQMDYEDFIRTYGVTVRQDEASPELHRPELLRHIREWTYPTNTIDPSDGTPRSAVSFSIAGKADKDRFFKEPGFIIGLVGVRPKVYLSNQLGSFSPYLQGQLPWLPAVLNDHPEKSYLHIADGAPITVDNDTGGYWVDPRDLFIHGEQFSNFALDAAGNGVPLPTAAGNRRYPAAADVDALFVTPETKSSIKADGVVSLSILGRQQEVTPGSKL